ncbi:MAG: metallophosphoesterase [Candidatus Promineifilaceae bacterium]|nr:metallophosphoesterase [Candidatus Promineifilaceae bacterium]
MDIAPRQPLYFAHISDTHIGPDPGYTRHGHAPLPCAERVVEIINDLPTRPDFVIHTGDIVADPDPAAYRLAARVFERLEAPVYYVVGNHDRARDIDHFLPMGPRQDACSDRDRLAYTFDVKGYRFLVLDARGPDEIDPRGLLPEAQIALAQEQADDDGPPLSLFIHSPPLPINSPWMDANMLVQNGHRLHEALLPARGRVHGVFHGHVHQPLQLVHDGILYCAAASTFAQFHAWPTDFDVQFDPGHLPGYSFVHLLPQVKTIVRHHTFPRPEENR